MFKLNKEKLYILRAKHCLTVGELAEKAGVSRRELSIDKPVGAKSLGKIAQALNVDPEALIVREQEGE